MPSPARDEQLRQIVAYAYQNASAVRALMDAAQITPEDVQSLADLPKLPILSKDRMVALQQANPPFGGFVPATNAALRYIFVSPGPIYDPVPHGKGLGPTSVEPLKVVGFGPSDRVINTFAYHLTPAGLGMDEGLRACGCTVIPTGPGNTTQQVDVMLGLGVTGFVGTPSFLGTLLDEAAARGAGPGALLLRRAFFSAEPYTAAQRARFQGEYGLVTVSAYGTADLGFVAYEVPGAEGYCVSDLVHVEIADPLSGQPVPPGEMGEIVVTTFNQGYPLLRFGTGDLGKLSAEAHPVCGGQHLLGLYGRSGEAIKVRGMFLHPNQLRLAAARVPGVGVVQAMVTRPASSDVLALQVELAEGVPATHDVPAQLADALRAVANLRADTIDVVPTGTLDPSARIITDARTWD